MWESIKNLIKKMLKPISETPWLDIAEGELGILEIEGPGDHPRIVEYHQTTTLKATDDEVPWCSSFVNWVMEQVGYQGTSSARARSWAKWGKKIKDPKPGAIVILSRGKNPALGHVGFFMGFANSGRSVSILGGNQSNSVSIQNYPVSRVVSFRWPDLEV